MKVKRLIPALAMLLIAAMLMGTSTFAWFSMNDRVTANNINIEVKSNTTYLLISDTETTAAGIQGDGLITVDLAAISGARFPVAPASAVQEVEYYTAADELADPTHVEGTVKTASSATNWVAGTDDPADLTWYSMIGTNPTSTGYVGRANTHREIATPDLETDYVIKQTLYFTLAVGSEDAEDLVVTKCTFTTSGASGTTAADSFRCLVVGETDSVLFTGTDADGDATVLSATTGTITDATVVSVDVYVYFDGNQDDIYTNNIDDIGEFTVSLEFGVTVA